MTGKIPDRENKAVCLEIFRIQLFLKNGGIRKNNLRFLIANTSGFDIPDKIFQIKY